MRKRLAVQVGCFGLLAPAFTLAVMFPSRAQSVGQGTPAETSGRVQQARPAASRQTAQGQAQAKGQPPGQAQVARSPWADAPASDFVGSEACAQCHEPATATYRKSAHHLAQTETSDAASCESCHGPGRRHVEAGGDRELIFSYNDADRTVRELSAPCLTCHGSDEHNFLARSGEHMKGSIACSSCHKPHQAATREALLMQAGHTACLACHAEVKAEINLNERHRIKEGVVKCVDCHDPHGPSGRSRLGPFNNQKTCNRCHTDKQGPFVFEHPAVRVEGCLSCHRAHGGINRHMLLYQSTARLCYSCHTVVPAFHTRFNETTNCVNCHSAIHGSNLDPFFLR